MPKCPKRPRDPNQLGKAIVATERLETGKRRGCLRFSIDVWRADVSPCRSTFASRLSERSGVAIGSDLLGDGS